MIRVLKIGGRPQNDPALAERVAAAGRQADVQLCIVHGGGDEVSVVQRRMGQEPQFAGGRRVTSAEDVEIVRMVLSGTINKRLVRQLLAAGLPAVGLSGEDGGLLPAAHLDGGRLGAVGVPTLADVRVLDALMSHGFVPVISPLGRDAETGAGLNINGDDAAAAIAAGLRADELFLLVDVPAVLGADGAPLASLDVEASDALIATGVARAGMAAKLEAARRALAAGVRDVRIGDLAALDNRARGTVITCSPSAV